jgi:hypothetical protein
MLERSIKEREDIFEERFCRTTPFLPEGIQTIRFLLQQHLMGYFFAYGPFDLFAHIFPLAAWADQAGPGST